MSKEIIDPLLNPLIDLDLLLPSDVISSEVSKQSPFVPRQVGWWQAIRKYGTKSCHLANYSNRKGWVKEAVLWRAKHNPIDWDVGGKFNLAVFRLKNRNQIVEVPCDLSHMNITNRLRKRILSGFKDLGMATTGYRKKARCEHIQDFYDACIEAKIKYDIGTILSAGHINFGGMHCAEIEFRACEYALYPVGTDRIPKPNEVVSLNIFDLMYRRFYDGTFMDYTKFREV